MDTYRTALRFVITAGIVVLVLFVVLYVAR
jgi:hypothetical protein